MTNPDVPSSSIASSGLSADISALGAELTGLRDEAGRDLLWGGDPAFWTGRAPLLFPIVGRLKEDHLRVGGVAYPMRQHGLARTSTFDLVERDAESCRLRLRSSVETRRSYPFDFTLDVTYRVDVRTLSIDAVVGNIGTEPMPAAFGFHPAFRWPLPYGGDRAVHQMLFEHEEPDPIAPLAGGLLAGAPTPSPVQGRILPLDDALFAKDAVIFLAPRSRSLRYGAPGGRSITVDFADMPQLGIWSKPGAGFVCIEPWHGYASPADFDGDLSAKPGMVSIPPEGTRVFSMRVTLDGATPTAA